MKLLPDDFMVQVEMSCWEIDTFRDLFDCAASRLRLSHVCV